MNQQERATLRYKHRCLESKVGPWCRSCMHGWPCDVIKVLNAWDERTNGLVSPAQTNTGIPYVEGYQGRQGTQGAWEKVTTTNTTSSECDHADWTSNAYSEDIYADMGYRYCPKCGEKL